MNKKTFFLLLIFGLATKAVAQNRVVLKIAISNEATAIPFTQFLSKPFHPTIQVGTQIPYRDSPFYQTLNIGYIFHKNLYQGFYFNSEVGYDYKFDFGLNLKTLLGVGYLRTFTTQDEYQLKGGKYVQDSDRGNGRIMPIISFGMGYRIKKRNVDSPELYMLYKSWIEYPYSPGFIPLMSHVNLEIGYKFNLK